MNQALDISSGYPISSLAGVIRRIGELPAATDRALDGICGILADLKQYPPEGTLYLDILEEIRKPLYQTINVLGKSRYQDTALPQMEREAAAFNQVISSLRLMNEVYRHCKSLLPEEVDSRYHAQILHRNIYYITQIIFEHFRARLDLPGELWQEAHGYYQEAEQQSLATRPIIDTLGGGQSISCTASYIALLLVDLANPYRHSIEAQELIARLARLGAPYVEIEMLDSMHEIPPFILDLGEDLPLHPPSDNEVLQTVRCLNTRSLVTHMEVLHTRLKDAETPQIPLGDDRDKVDRLFLIATLEQIYAPWAQTRIPRRFRRHVGQGRVEVCNSFEQVHLAISGTTFTQPQGQYIYNDRMLSDSADIIRLSRLDDRQIASDKATPKARSHFNLRPDGWAIVDQSASGFRLFRALAGSSIAYGELLAIQPPDSDQYVLAEVSWLMQDASCLHMGIAILPGMPKAVAAAVANDDKNPRQNANRSLLYEQAFLMPALEPLGIEPSLILSAELWKLSEGKVSLAAENNIVPITLEKVIRKGRDFVRTTYKAAS
ncbi:MAG: hypothetical protein LBQ75_00790 [Zoogloeaceae bacterium]|jgi:hypothetical protein|nr:hypothetical protein [Zoogloeaceae bacterium]